MNILYYSRVNFYLILYDNVDITKLIKSIKNLNKTNKIFKIEECDATYTNREDCNIYIFIKNNTLNISYSHLYYDGYSIGFILEKIDQIYKDEIENYKFDFYDNKYSNLNLIKNSIKIIPKYNYKNLYYGIFKKRNKKTIKILKTKFNELSTKEITHYLVDRLKIENYCLTLNARKKYTEYEGVLGNLVYYSGILNKNTNIKKHTPHNTKNNENDNIEKVINSSCPLTLQVNSYLNFKLPSFIKYFSPPSVNIFTGNYILIHPVNNNEKYIIVDYYLFT
jgi:hypothetical protein